MSRYLLSSRRLLGSIIRGCSSRPEPGQSSTFFEIGNRRIFSEEHDLLRHSVRKFVEEHVSPHHERWENEGQCDRELWLKAGEHCLLGIATPESYGGHGGDILSAAVVWEELHYANCTGPGFHVHSDVVMPYITHNGSDAQKKKYLKKMTKGEWIGAIALTEHCAGSDLQSIRTNAKRDGDDWILNGSKTFVSNGYMADVAIVLAVTNPEAKSPAHGLSFFLVDTGAAGVSKGQKLKKMGLKAQDTSELFFDDVRLSSNDLLGEPNKAFQMIMNQIPLERIYIAVASQATAEFVFEQTRAYVKSRKAFGGTLSDFQTTRHRLAEMKTSLCVSRAFVDQCLEHLNRGCLDNASASMAKYWASDVFNNIAYSGVQLHGGYGYIWDYPVCKAFVDARVQSIYGGANEVMKEIIGRSIVK